MFVSFHWGIITMKTAWSHLPNHGRHHLTGEEYAEHGESLREQQPHDREHQHQATMQVCHTEGQRVQFLRKYYSRLNPPI